MTRNHRVTIQQKTATRNSIGEEVVTWVTLAEVWASVSPLRGREFFASAQMTATVDTRIEIAYRTDVVPEMRVLHRDVPYDVRSVIDPNTRHEKLELMCRTGVHDGR